MKIFKHWSTEKATITINNEAVQITCYGGSNASLDDAARRATEKVDLIRRKVAGETGIFQDYETEIREEILQVIDDQAVITRNRYGAQVLNAENLMFLDIDKPRGSSGGLFQKSSPEKDKEKIFEMVRKLAANSKYTGLTFRIYETCQGARVIVPGNAFDPRDRATMEMMNEFNCDPLYTSICRKQACFRARLTPKPYRMKMKAYKVQFPRESADTRFEAWLAGYEQESRNYNVCRFIDQVGGSESLNEVICLHDEVTGANTKNLPLA